MSKKKYTVSMAQETGAELVEALLAKEAVPVTTEKRGVDGVVHGVVIGNVLAIFSPQEIQISIPGQGIAETIALPMCSVEQLVVGAAVAVMFVQGDVARPLIIGVMAPDIPQVADSFDDPVEEEMEHEHIVIEAAQEIELRCGDAAIIMTRDGRILLRGTYISSHASATQRIRGGAVQIN